MRKPWQKQESRLANLLDGEVNAGSGNGWSRKSDVRTKRRVSGYLVEAKQTDNKGFRITLDALRQLEHHAAMDSRTPVFGLQFGHGSRARHYVIVREEDFFGDDPHRPPTAS